MTQHQNRALALWPLCAVTLVNYAAQVPYYIHNDYSPRHPVPGIRAIALMSFTLVWFLLGFIAYERGKSWGKPVLMSFLLVEAAFYLITILTGIFVAQLRDHSLGIDAIFVVGYLSGAVAAYYAFRLRQSGAAT